MPTPLLLILLPVMVLFFEVTLIPTSLHGLTEFVALNPTSVILSSVNVIALSLPFASTTGCPTPLSVTDLSTTTFS